MKYKELDEEGESSDFEFTADLSVYKDSKKTWLAFSKCVMHGFSWGKHIHCNF